MTGCYSLQDHLMLALHPLLNEPETLDDGKQVNLQQRTLHAWSADFKRRRSSFLE